MGSVNYMAFNTKRTRYRETQKCYDKIHLTQTNYCTYSCEKMLTITIILEHFLHSTITELQVIANACLQLLTLRTAQPVIRFRGQAFFFSDRAMWLWILFSLQNKNLNLKTGPCVFLSYLSLIIFKFVWWSVWGGNTFSHHCILLCVLDTVQSNSKHLA